MSLFSGSLGPDCHLAAVIAFVVVLCVGNIVGQRRFGWFEECYRSERRGLASVVLRPGRVGRFTLTQGSGCFGWNLLPNEGERAAAIAKEVHLYGKQTLFNVLFGSGCDRYRLCMTTLNHNCYSESERRDRRLMLAKVC